MANVEVKSRTNYFKLREGKTVEDLETLLKTKNEDNVTEDGAVIFDSWCGVNENAKIEEHSVIPGAYCILDFVIPGLPIERILADLKEILEPSTVLMVSEIQSEKHKYVVAYGVIIDLINNKIEHYDLFGALQQKVLNILGITNQIEVPDAIFSDEQLQKAGINKDTYNVNLIQFY